MAGQAATLFMSNPRGFIILIAVVILIALLLIVGGLCVLTLFMPVILIIVGLYILARGPFPVQIKTIIGLALIGIGAVMLVLTW